ncbi:MAG: undecaprenyl-diphosphatase [Candidatus Pacebacteria bacterium]|nr:undecaprenyl-diphosphatase [Candidatus Paceibacterota bacterium]
MDVMIFQKLNILAGKYVCLDSVAIFFAEYLGYFLILAVVVFFLFKLIKFRSLKILFSDYWKFAAKISASVFLSRVIITEGIRLFWERPRPFVENQVNLILEHPATGSFPSGHSTFFFALAAAIYFYNKKAGTILFIASFLIAISRVFAGVHWPSDILGGAVIGIFSAWLVNKIFNVILNKNHFYKK